MTDASYPTHTLTGHPPAHPALPNALAFAQNHRFTAPVFDGTQEDDGQISCFCGFVDDDGNTVACDGCNRWQHTLCYYPEYDGRDLPGDLEHFCVDCRPRPVNRPAAHARQQARREQQDSATSNGAKRQVPKSHKKKVKDAAPPYTNGWPMDNKFRHDRNSASPRDHQPPPAKRPKTSHRNSDHAPSAKGHSRKRTMTTNAGHRRSLSRSPDTPTDLYSQDFIQCYRDDHWTYSEANVMDELRVTNELSEWLQASDEDFQQRMGCKKPEVFQRWDGSLDDIPGRPDPTVQDQFDPDVRDADGRCPEWKTIMLQEPVAAGAFIGELRGRIGFQEEYRADPSNRWAQLRHPEPFVFFHHRLPIYIDARHEGTKLRYVRRSCQPNANLQILITNGTDYHFCLMANTHIEPGTEISVGWWTLESTMTRVGDVPSSKDMVKLSKWVSTVLANHGPCACQLPLDQCYMARFDRRGHNEGSEEEQEEEGPHPGKAPKGKKKKAGNHLSPANTHALNSRSGSEVRKVEPDDEPTDSRSASGSAGRDSVSRDNTPNTHYSTNGSLSAMPVEMTERERKKLAKEEELFKRQDQEQSSKREKKKRHSAGSNATTPGPTTTTTKHLHSATTTTTTHARYVDAGTAKQAGLPSAKVGGKRPRSAAPKQSSKTAERVVKRVKPSYEDAETQCDLDGEDAVRKETEVRTTPAATPRKFQTHIQRMLQRCAVNNTRLRKIQSPQAASPQSHARQDAAMRSPSPRSPNVASPEPAPADLPVVKPEDRDDVHMADAPDVDAAQPTFPTGLAAQEFHPQPLNRIATADPLWSHRNVEPPAPPWPNNNHNKSSPLLPQQDDQHQRPHHPQPDTHRHEEMHIDMPPPPPTQSFVASSAPLGSGPLAQSPASLFPPPHPSPAAAAGAANMAAAITATASPAKKKSISLSEWSKRNKAGKDKDSAVDKMGGAADRESSPASVASGPLVQPAGPPGAAVGRAGSQAIEDGDVRMEDGAGVQG